MQERRRGSRLPLWLVMVVPAFGLVIIADMIGAHLIGYGRQQVEIVSIEYTGYHRAPYRLNYVTADGKSDHMAWPNTKPGAEKCLPGMAIDVVTSLSVGTAKVDTCHYAAKAGEQA